MAHAPESLPSAPATTQEEPPHSTVTITTTSTTWTRTRTARNNPAMVAGRETTPPRAVSYMREDIPANFLTVAPMSTTPGLSDDWVTMPLSSTAALSISAATPSSEPVKNQSKMNALHVPEPPMWVACFLGVLLLFLFLVAALLALATFPPRHNLRRHLVNFTQWLSRVRRRGRGQYRAVYASNEDDEDYESEQLSCPRRGDGGQGHTTSTPDLEKCRKLRKRNPKDLRINTAEAKGAFDLGICIPSASTSRSSGGSAGSLRSARRFLCEEKWDNIETRAGGGGVLKRFEKGIEYVADWSGMALTREVKTGGTEKDLLFRVRDCEREGWKG